MLCPDSRAEQAGVSAPCAGCAASRRVSRRTLLKSALGAGLYLQFARLVDGEAEEPQKARPQAGDFLVSLLGDRQGQALTPHDVPMGGPPLIVYPMDPATQTIRNGSRLNRVLVVRLALEGLVEQTRALAADGVLGYSAICPHTGCDVTGWKSDTQYIVCPCHASTFDPRDRARVVSGPASRSLAALPLQLVDGKITVAGPFLGKVGAEQK
ncbi:MAG TPA: Rieske 2Fe-2S domain-containing protein [Methylomirabilota bacterium]|nr:Rieske 2Fe-2S domain-containing protein [Methylomirabilota bacterium]